MAAARVGAMSLADLNGRLDKRFRLLTGGGRNALARQRTLRAMVDWSLSGAGVASRPVLRRGLEGDVVPFGAGGGLWWSGCGGPGELGEHGLEGGLIGAGERRGAGDRCQ